MTTEKKKWNAPLRAFHFYPVSRIKAIRNFDHPLVQMDVEKIPMNEENRGWAFAPWGWVICPRLFQNGFLGACVFSRLEPHTQYPNYVKCWIYTSSLRQVFESDSRDNFICWINSIFLKEIHLNTTA